MKFRSGIIQPEGAPAPQLRIGKALDGGCSVTRPTRDLATGDLFRETLPPGHAAAPQAEAADGIPWDRRYGPEPGVRWQHAGRGFAPSPIRARSVRQGSVAALGQVEGFTEQEGLGDLAAPAVDAQAIADELQAFAGGRLTESLATLVLDTLRRRDTTKTALARAIGVEPPPDRPGAQRLPRP